MPSGFTHAVACVRTAFLLGWTTFIVWMDHGLLVRSVEGHMEYLHSSLTSYNICGITSESSMIQKSFTINYFINFFFWKPSKLRRSEGCMWTSLVFRNERFRVFILFPSSVCYACACVCLQTCAVRVHGVCRCARAYVCARVVVGHRIGAWSPRWAGRRRWDFPMGSLLWWHLCPTSAHILCLDAAWCPVVVSPSMKSPGREPRRCHPPSTPTRLQVSKTWARSTQNWPSGWTDWLSTPDCEGLSFLGVRGSAACWKPATLQPGHFQSVLEGHGAGVQEVPGSPLDPDPHVAAEPGHSFVLLRWNV